MMVGLGDGEERALWRRWSMPGSAETPAPDALDLAAYAEGRLSESAAAPIEHWLAAHPAALSEILGDIAAARAATLDAAPIADAAIIAKAAALVTGAPSNVVPLRRAAPAWRNALAWSSVAASLLAASLVGFAMGSDAYQNLARTQTVDSASSDTLDPVATLDSTFSDDSGT
jgi:hypothetical protein